MTAFWRMLSFLKATRCTIVTENLTLGDVRLSFALPFETSYESAVESSTLKLQRRAISHELWIYGRRHKERECQRPPCPSSVLALQVLAAGRGAASALLAVRVVSTCERSARVRARHCERYFRIGSVPLLYVSDRARRGSLDDVGHHSDRACVGVANCVGRLSNDGESGSLGCIIGVICERRSDFR